MLNVAHAHLAKAIASYGVLCAADEVPQTSGPLWEACPYKKPNAAYDKVLILKPEVDWSFQAGRHKTQLPLGIRPACTGVINYHCCSLSPEWVEQRIRRNFARMPEGQRSEAELRYRLRRGLSRANWRKENCLDGLWKTRV
jgi:hypothetical protein